MKKHFTIKPVLIALLAMISCTMKAEIYYYPASDGFVYHLNTETQEASLYKYSGEATEVVIPEFITYIGGKYKVTSLESYSFCGCSLLTSIKIPSSVRSLGTCCFYGCFSLMSIEIPSSVISLGRDCFASCPSLESIVVDAANPKYDSREGCNAIILTYYNEMIVGCKNTRFPSSVKTLGTGCFSGCSSLKSIEIPAFVTRLWDPCFSGCSSLESIVVDANNPVYDSREGCNAIIERESNTMIAGCKNTRIPSSVTSLGDYCFLGCSSLTSIEIPSSVTSLGWNCFGGCSSLESIVVDANNPVYDSREGCNAIIETGSNTMIAGCKSTRIPSSVTCLGDYCFSGCSSLTSVVIPSSVTSLGACCFCDCPSLNTVICKMEKVSECGLLFGLLGLVGVGDDTPIESATLYVPERMLDAYKSTSPWSGFGTILPWTEELEVSVDETPELGITLNTNNGNVVVSGLADGTQVSCYTVDGRMLGKVSADGGTATFTAEPNSIVIVKAGRKSFKVYVK